MRNKTLFFFSMVIITFVFMVSCVKTNSSISYFDNGDCYSAQITDFESAALEIMSEYNNKPVKILNQSVTINYNLESIYMPSITTITSDCFKDYYNLSFVHIPKIKEIGSNAFYNCKSLKMLYFPSSLRNIADYAFKNCLNLDVIFVEDDIEVLGKYVFPKNVTIISKKDSNIWKYAIRNNLNHLEATIDLANLFKSNYKNNLENLVIKNIKYNNIDHSSLFNHKIKDLDNLMIPNNVVNVLNNSLSFTNIITLNTNDAIELCDNSISNCTLLKYVFIPNANVIGINTFKNSINLNTIFISSDYISISSSSFNETKLNLKIYILGDAAIEDGAIPKLSTVWCNENSNVHNYVLKNNIKHVLI